MDQLEILWKYQELDLQMDQLNLDIRSSDSRQKLLKLRNYLVKQEKLLVKLDNEAEQKGNQCNKIQQECDLIHKSIQEGLERLKSNEDIEISELDEMSKQSVVLKDRLIKKEAELQMLHKELASFSKKLNDIRLKINKAKNEYTAVKNDYDKEVASLRQDLAELKKQRDSLEPDIDKELMTKYKNIKASKSPVISLMESNQCGGCFMSLASLVAQNVKDRKKVIQCENCGRILYYRD